MSLLKKLSLLVVCMGVFLITGCGGKVENIEGTLEELMTSVYSGLSDEQKPMMLMNTEVNEENIEYYLGASDIEYEEALASESAVGSIAHSVVLVRVKDNANIENIKTKIKDNVDPRKWICVGVEAENVIVENRGNLIILIMVEDQTTRDTLKKGFENL